MVKVSPAALQRARNYGLDQSSVDLQQLLEYFVVNSAITTHPLGNRRYGGYILRVQGETLLDIHPFRESIEVCHGCYGVGFFPEGT